MSKPALIRYAGCDRRPMPSGYQVNHGKGHAILALWRQGMDTTDIAARVKMSEASVYNWLAKREGRP